jgi:SSS family solute:Na+ symporter
VAVNLSVAVVGTVVLRMVGASAGRDLTRPEHYFADEGDPRLNRMTELIDGTRYHAAHAALSRPAASGRSRQ